MVAQGIDPDKIMGKIDENWDNYEQEWQSGLEKGEHSEKDKNRDKDKKSRHK